MKKDGLKIAISSKSGCGTTTVSKLISQTLDLRMINYTFRNMAQELGMELKDLLALADSDDSWDRGLDAKQVALSQAGNCVLGSRLAIWLLKDADLKVYLTASPEVRSSRINQREGGDFATVMAWTMERDAHDRQRYLKLYGIDNDQFDFVDLCIDTTNRRPEMILEDIIYALRIKNLIS
jgi:cytidylate kinase